MTHIGCPLVGDRRYLTPEAKKTDARLREHITKNTQEKGHLLHAHKISFVHPGSQKPMEIVCPWDL